MCRAQSPSVETSRRPLALEEVSVATLGGEVVREK
jgi:hypothetical protein